jgi:uncharacterized protein GlcG (DUF336 family)
MFTEERLGLDEATRALDAILAAVTSDDSPIALAVVDEHGVLITCARADGAPQRMIRRATAKAYTAANLGRDTVEFRDNEIKAKERTLNDWGDPMITSLQGGLAIRSKGKVVGGIAMSGNTTTRDEELAGIGLKAMGLS